MNKELIKLISENPTLPILANVFPDVCYLGEWSGQIGQVKSVRLTKCTWHNHIDRHGRKTGERKMVEYDDREDIFFDLSDLEEYKNHTDEELNQIVEELDWKEAIILYVDTVEE